VTDHRVPDIPVYPCADLANIWKSTCACGYGLTGDSPEAVIVAMAMHLDPHGDNVLKRSSDSLSGSWRDDIILPVVKSWLDDCDSEDH
jgi:hypothetical protein